MFSGEKESLLFQEPPCCKQLQCFDALRLHCPPVATPSLLLARMVVIILFYIECVYVILGLC